MSSSVGMMTFPTEWKNKINDPNHQADLEWEHDDKPIFRSNHFFNPTGGQILLGEATL